MINVLIVDDSSFQIEIIKSKISSFGYNVISATNGIDGLKKIDESLPDVIIIDILMPQMNGFQFIREVTNRKLDIPIIVNSADIQETTKQECLKLGAFAFLNKPLKKQEIFDTINKALDSKQKKISNDQNK